MKGHVHDRVNRRGFGQGQQGGGSGGYCICPQCGYSVNHQPGIPCKSLVCPDCKVSLLRNESPGNKTVAEPMDIQPVKPVVSERKILYPKVIAEKCTACGACIEICPTDTIVMENGKAFVKIDNCRNCKICIKACPENAFILE